MWAGLWSLPETADESAARDWFARQCRGTLDSAVRLPTAAHGFSHYLLDIAPMLWRNVRLRPRIADNADLRWAARDELLSIGLPSPVRKLISSSQAREP